MEEENPEEILEKQNKYKFFRYLVGIILGIILMGLAWWNLYDGSATNFSLSVFILGGIIFVFSMWKIIPVDGEKINTGKKV